MVFFCAWIIAGLYFFSRLDIEAYPDPSPPLVEVITQNPAWSAEEMERQVTVPIETVLFGIPRITYVRSISIFGLSDVKLYFDYDSDYFWDRQEVAQPAAARDFAHRIFHRSFRLSLPSGKSIVIVLRGLATLSTSSRPRRTGWSPAKSSKFSGIVDVASFSEHHARISRGDRSRETSTVQRNVVPGCQRHLLQQCQRRRKLSHHGEPERQRPWLGSFADPPRNAERPRFRTQQRTGLSARRSQCQRIIAASAAAKSELITMTTPCRRNCPPVSAANSLCRAFAPAQTESTSTCSTACFPPECT